MFHNSRFRSKEFQAGVRTGVKRREVVIGIDCLQNIDWNNNRDDGNWLKMVDAGCC